MKKGKNMMTKLKVKTLEEILDRINEVENKISLLKSSKNKWDYYPDIHEAILRLESYVEALDWVLGCVGKHVE